MFGLIDNVEIELLPSNNNNNNNNNQASFIKFNQFFIFYKFQLIIQTG